MWANGLPNDPVMWDDWRDAYAEATTAGSALNSEFCRAQVNLSDGHLALLDAFSVMMVFLEGIFDRSGEDLQLFEVVGRLMSPLSDSGCLNDSLSGLSGWGRLERSGRRVLGDVRESFM